ncbi:uncharacterized protein LOC144639803 [Oculina patagonica]
MTTLFKTLFQFAISIAIISRSASFARKISLEDEEVDIREFNDFSSLRGRPRYQHSHESKGDGKILPEVGCSPYPEVVQVDTAATFVRNRPEFVLVNRCKGACDLPLNSQKCSPTATRYIPVQVTSGDGRSYHRFVEDHLACACECRMSCTKHHYADETNCRCNCKEKCKDDKNQDPTTCKCTARVGKRRDEIAEY